MPSATAPAASAPAMTRAARARPADSGFTITRREEDQLIQLDLSDLALPKVNDLQVDGLKASFWSRLFGK